MTPADLKAEGQSRSLFSLTETDQQAFDRILAEAGNEFSSNDVRPAMDAAGISKVRRGAMFTAALVAGQIVRKMTADGPPWRIPSTDPSAHGAFVQMYTRPDLSGLDEFTRSAR